MKYLIMCEGTNEKTIIELLLEHNKLAFTQDDLINLEVYHARQFVPYITSEVKHYSGDIKVLRIGDKQSDILKIPQEISHDKNIYKCRTSYELEILLIINEGLFKEFLKVKSKVSAKDFAKEYIKYNGKFYDGSCEFWQNYYHRRINNLVNNIKECKRLTKLKKNEICRSLKVKAFAFFLPSYLLKSKPKT